MKHRTGIIGIALLFSLLIGCGTKKETTSVADLYRNRAQELIAAGDYETATIALEEGIRVTQDESLSEMLQTIRDQNPAREAQTEEPDSQAEPTPSATAAPTETPMPSPTPSPRPTPEGMPNVVSFYTPKGKSYSPRMRMGDVSCTIHVTRKKYGEKV